MRDWRRQIEKGNTLDKDKKPGAPESEADKKQKNDAAQQPGSDPRLVDESKTPGSGMFPDTGGDAPSG